MFTFRRFRLQGYWEDYEQALPPHPHATKDEGAGAGGGAVPTARAETAAYVEEKKDEALHLNNEIARLKKTLEQKTLLKQETARARDGMKSMA